MKREVRRMVRLLLHWCAETSGFICSWELVGQKGKLSVYPANRETFPFANHWRQITFKRDAIRLIVEACRMIQ